MRKYAKWYVQAPIYMQNHGKSNLMLAIYTQKIVTRILLIVLASRDYLWMGKNEKPSNFFWVLPGLQNIDQNTPISCSEV
jgi:hypothetical protein